jgi:hypothetical protein
MRILSGSVTGIQTLSKLERLNTTVGDAQCYSVGQIERGAYATTANALHLLQGQHGQIVPMSEANRVNSVCVDKRLGIVVAAGHRIMSIGPDNRARVVFTSNDRTPWGSAAECHSLVAHEGLLLAAVQGGGAIYATNRGNWERIEGLPADVTALELCDDFALVGTSQGLRVLQLTGGSPRVLGAARIDRLPIVRRIAVLGRDRDEIVVGVGVHADNKFESAGALALYSAGAEHLTLREVRELPPKVGHVVTIFSETGASPARSSSPILPPSLVHVVTSRGIHLRQPIALGSAWDSSPLGFARWYEPKRHVARNDLFVWDTEPTR